MKSVTFYAHGIPKGQPRPRAFSRGGSARVYTPGTAEAWKGAIALAAKPHIPATPISGPISLSIFHDMPRPKSHRTPKGILKPAAPKNHTSKPDADNLLKAAMDALTHIGMWHDDDQVCEVTVTKRYGDSSGAQIVIVDLEAANN